MMMGNIALLWMRPLLERVMGDETYHLDLNSFIYGLGRIL